MYLSSSEILGAVELVFSPPFSETFGSRDGHHPTCDGKGLGDDKSPLRLVRRLASGSGSS
jgi:hypothetical protein